MPRTSKGTSKKRQKSSGTSSGAAASINGANGESPSVSTRQNEVPMNVAAGKTGASASPSEQTRIMGARMSGVKHSGLLAKDGKEK